ncbi:hydrogenase expression/formation protein HypE [Actinomycetota bacterium]
MNKDKKEFSDNIIQLSHGDGGLKSSQLINDLLLDYIGNDILQKLEDSAVLKLDNDRSLSFTTDSFVVNPIFFPGGDIGKLSICGTINDLVTSGCEPLALSLSFILEEGFPIPDFKKILTSVSKMLAETGLNIITGDTKVVEKGSVDKIFINTAGIGIVDNKYQIGPDKIEPGDKIIINGTIADHGLAILSQRKEFNFKTDIISDCAPLYDLVKEMTSTSDQIHALRDATRGGLATVLFEIARNSGLDMDLSQESVPLKKQARGICEFLGMDPLYIANEGKMVVFVGSNDANNVLEVMRSNKYGKDSAIIGEVVKKGKGIVILKTEIGTERFLDLHYSEQLPRIC